MELDADEGQKDAELFVDSVRIIIKSNRPHEPHSALADRRRGRFGDRIFRLSILVGKNSRR